jgi:hypothetical protein
MHKCGVKYLDFNVVHVEESWICLGIVQLFHGN